MVAGPAVGHGAVRKGGTERHRLRCTARAERLVVHGIHHHLRVDRHREGDAVTRAGYIVVRIGRCYRERNRLGGIRRIGQSHGGNVARAVRSDTRHILIVADPVVTHCTSCEGSAEVDSGHFIVMAEGLVCHRIHHNDRIHCQVQRHDAVAAVNSTSMEHIVTGN